MADVGYEAPIRNLDERAASGHALRLFRPPPGAVTAAHRQRDPVKGVEIT